MTMSNRSGGSMRSRSSRASDWMDAKTCRHSLGRSPRNKAFAECAVAHDMAECGHALGENLVTMCDKEQSVYYGLCLETTVVESSDDRLARASRHHEEVSIHTVQVSF